MSSVNRTSRFACPAWRMLLVGLLMAAAPVSAEIYKYRDAQGLIHLTDRPMKGDVRLLKVYRGYGHKRSGGSFNAERYRKNRKRYSPLIDEVAQQEKLQPNLLHAVVSVESAYDPEADDRRALRG